MLFGLDICKFQKKSEITLLYQNILNKVISDLKNIKKKNSEKIIIFSLQFVVPYPHLEFLDPPIGPESHHSRLNFPK
jgi:hypothetical protein